MTRRARGEGTVGRRADGRWWGRIDLGAGPHGRRSRRYFYGATQAEVVRQMREYHKRDSGAQARGRAPTVGAFLEQWLTAVEPSVRYTTYQRYAGLCRGHLIPGLGRHQLDKLSPADVEALLAGKLSAGLAPRTVQHLRAVLRTALNRALKWGIIARNAAALAEPVHVARHPAHVLDAEQAKRFLDAVRGDRLEALYRVALSLGLRQGEALGLRWGDVDLDRGRLDVTHTLQWQRRGSGPRVPVLVEPKTACSRRRIMLPAPTLAALRQHRQRQVEERLLAGGRWQERGLVFTGRLGQPVLNTYLLVQFRRHLTGAGLPPMRFHELRHSAASLLIAQGVPLKMVSELLGHSTITLTADTYGHLAEAAQRQAADAMERILDG